MNNYNKFLPGFQLKIVKANSYHDDLTGGMPSGRRQEMRETSKPKLFREKKIKEWKKNRCLKEIPKKGNNPSQKIYYYFGKKHSFLSATQF